MIDLCVLENAFRRHAILTPFARRLTPVEVAQNWFRRGAAFAKDIHATFPYFPKPGPDGLYLLTEVEAWFDRFHGHKEVSPLRKRDKEAAMRAARGH